MTPVQCRDCTPPNTPSKVPWSRGICSSPPASWLKRGLIPLCARGYLHFRCGVWRCSMGCVTRAHGRSWWPQVELMGCWLLFAVLLNAECSKPGVKYTGRGGRGEPFSRASFKCPVQILCYFEKEVIALLPFTAPTPSHH